MKVKDSQTLIDIAVQTTGDIDGVFDLIQSNAINSLTDNLQPGLQLNFTKVINSKVADFFASTGIIIATKNIAYSEKSGIGFYKIGSTFKIS